MNMVDRQLTPDPGLFTLEILLRLLKVELDAERLRQALDDRPMGVAEMLGYAKTIGLVARCVEPTWDGLPDCALPGIAALTNGHFLLLGRVSAEAALVLMPGATQPSMMTRAEFEAVWDGRLVLIAKRAGVAARLAPVVSAVAGGAGHASRWLAHRLRGATDRSAGPILPVALASRKPAVGTALVGMSDRARKLGRVISGLSATDHRQPAEIAFLPAALEIVETPPSPTGRAIALSIVAVFSAALAWASIGTVDIVAVAPGKLIPGGRTKTIQPFETGVVRAIHVRDGQTVRSGDTLIELDATMTDAELGHLKSDLMGARLDAARLRAALAGTADPLVAFTPPDGASPSSVEMHRRFLASQTAEQRAKMAAIDQQVKQKEAERATSMAAIEKLRATLQPLQQRVAIREQLYQKELGSKLTYLSDLQEFVGQQQEILVQQSRHSEAEAAISMLNETSLKAAAEYERGLFEELAKAEQKVAALEQDVIKAEQRTRLQKLAAPIDGMVQQLAVHTIGGVVTPAQTLMLIVPSDSRLEIEAMVSNRDVGFVEVGQDAAIKIDTFNFTRYGLLEGKVLNISQDAITRQKPPERPGDAGETVSSEPKGQELVYAARVSVDRTEMLIENKRVKLSAGMAVTVEIKNGSRSIISYLLSPLVRYKHESLRER